MAVGSPIRLVQNASARGSHTHLAVAVLEPPYEEEARWEGIGRQGVVRMQDAVRRVRRWWLDIREGDGQGKVGRTGLVGEEARSHAFAKTLDPDDLSCL